MRVWRRREVEISPSSPSSDTRMVGPLYRAGWRALKVRRGLPPLTRYIPSTSSSARSRWSPLKSKLFSQFLFVGSKQTESWADMKPPRSLLIDWTGSGITPRWFETHRSAQRPLSPKCGNVEPVNNSGNEFGLKTAEYPALTPTTQQYKIKK